MYTGQKSFRSVMAPTVMGVIVIILAKYCQLAFAY